LATALMKMKNKMSATTGRGSEQNQSLSKHVATLLTRKKDSQSCHKERHGFKKQLHLWIYESFLRTTTNVSTKARSFRFDGSWRDMWEKKLASEKVDAKVLGRRKRQYDSTGVSGESKTWVIPVE
jgi:hypothetical protein